MPSQQPRSSQPSSSGIRDLGQYTLRDLRTDAAEGTALVRGMYRIQWTATLAAGAEARAESIRGAEITVPAGGEFKRVQVDKLDAVPTGDGRVIYTAVVSVLDNPLPLVPIVWGLTALAGGVVSWLTLDKLQQFTESLPGSILTISAAALALWFAFKK